jgi:DUF1680 family protein
MKKTAKTSSKLLLAATLFTVSAQAQHQNRDYPIQPVTFNHVHVHDQFWAPRIDINADITIPYVLQKCREQGRIDNFLKAAGKKDPTNITEYPFDDTDIYKLIEGASYSLQVKPNPSLERSIDTLIGIIADAQEPDGYLYTFRTMKPQKLHPWIGAKRWEKDPDLSHELYNSGHLYEAATAHFISTGKKTLLNIATKNADLLVKDFGPGKATYFPGHQVVEMGLARLYRVTGKQAYLDLAKFFLDTRGKGAGKYSEYNQSQKPVTEQHEAVGHAVRAAYMYTGMADVAALTGDASYIKAIDDIWTDVVSKKMYLTGGIGATGAGEAFGAAYHLPNMSAYAETCASIANVYWNNRMFLLHGDASYIDVMERVLYNGLLSGVSQSGTKFFYPNPLASMGQHQRSAWFGCACCISNMTRFMPSIPGYVYAQNANNLYVNLFMSNQSDIKLPAGKLSIAQETAYPWKGKVTLKIDPTKSMDFVLRVRIPGWARQEAVPSNLYRFADSRATAISISINGKEVSYTIEKGYAVFNRTWKKGDLVEMDLPMEIEKVLANENVKEDKGRFAFQKGPLVYCLEGPDNQGGTVQNIVMSKDAAISENYEQQLLNGVLVLTGQGVATKRQVASTELQTTPLQAKAIPYYAWNNREASEMQVWIPFETSAARPSPAATIASKSVVSASINNKRMLSALNDQFEPASSEDKSGLYMHWWPKKDTKEWIQYDFDKAYTVSESKVYWYDDAPFGGCRIPANYTILYKQGDAWVPVKNLTPYAPVKDKYDVLKFEPVSTTAIRMEIQLPKDHATGVHEWIVQNPRPERKQEELPKFAENYPQLYNAFLTSVADAKVGTSVGVLPTLPSYLNGTYTGIQQGPTVRVIWPTPSDNSSVLKPGTYTIEGRVPGTTLKPKAIVTVKASVGQLASPKAKLVPFNLNQVSLNTNAIGQQTKFTENRDKFLQTLSKTDPNAFLYMFRHAFGQPQPSGTKALGVWDSKDTKLRGHATGHYLSALAQAYAGTGYDKNLQEVFAKKMDYMVNALYELAQLSGNPKDPSGPFVADARLVPMGPGKKSYDSDISDAGIRNDYWNWGKGFISAYPPDQFIMLEAGAKYGTQPTQIWAPYYTLHKILAGLIEIYEVSGNKKALDIATGMSNWVYARLSQVPTNTRISMWNTYIAGEFGGMNEVMAHLYRITKEPNYLKTAQLFDNIKVFFGDTTHNSGLAKNVDLFRGLHANQHIPQMVGSMETYRVSSNPEYYHVANNFWHKAVYDYSYSIGGVAGASNPNNPECFTTEPSTLYANGLSAGGQNETCATYNMLKLSSDLFQYDQRGELMDYYERALYNDILSSVAEHSPANTYHIPLRPGSEKDFGNPNMTGFTCCNGTALESNTKFQNTIYFKSTNDQALYVNLFIPSTLNWSSKKISVEQKTNFPQDDQTQFTIKGSGTFDLMVRVPAWATKGFIVSINGKVQALKAKPGAYLNIGKNWKNGDLIELKMPFQFHLEPLMDQQNIASLFYGPILLAAQEPAARKDFRKIVLNANDLGKTIQGNPKDLHFSIDDVPFKPFYETYGRHSVYLDVSLSKE